MKAETEAARPSATARRAAATCSSGKVIESFLPIGRYGSFSQHLREQFEGVIWRFRTGSQWREMPEEFGA